MAKHSSSIPLLLFLPLLFGHAILRSNAKPNVFYHFCMNQTGNYTISSTYKPNLTHLLTSIITNYTTSNTNGFYNLSYSGINAIALCRGDLDVTACLTCLNNSINLLPSLCPYQKEAIGWYDTCMLRYSNRTMFKAMETRPALTQWILDNVTDTEYHVFQSGLHGLLNSLRSKAALPSLISGRKYATGSVALMAPSYKTIYALAQCTPDLSRTECDNCLNDIYERIPTCCESEVRMLTPSCNMRYALYQFFLPTPVDLAPPPLLAGVYGAPPPAFPDRFP